MIRQFIAQLLILLTLGQVLMGADYYVSTTGNAANAGTKASPWTWECACDDSCNTNLAPGDTVWVRAGTYTTRCEVGNVDGDTNNRITFRAYPGERVIHDYQSVTPVITYGIELLNTSSFIDFRDIWTINSDTDRTVSSGTSVMRPGGVANRGNTNRFINMVLDNTGRGMDSWVQNGAFGRSDFIMSLIAGNGHQAETTGLTHSHYAQNSGDYITFYGIVALWPYSACMQFYGTASATVRRGIFDSGLCVWPGYPQDPDADNQGYDFASIGGNAGATDVVIRNYTFWSNQGIPQSVRASYEAGAVLLTIEDSLIAGLYSLQLEAVVPGFTTSGNKYYGQLRRAALGETKTVTGGFQGSPAKFYLADTAVALAYSSAHPNETFRATFSGATGSWTALNTSFDVVPTARVDAARNITSVTKGNPTLLGLNSSDAGWNNGELISLTGFTGDFAPLNGLKTVITGTSTTVTVGVDSTAYSGTYSSGASGNDFSEFTLKAVGTGTPFDCPACGNLTGTVQMQYALAPDASDTQNNNFPTTGQDIKYAKHELLPNVSRVYVNTWAAGTTDVDIDCTQTNIEDDVPIEIVDLFNYRDTTPWSSGMCAAGAISNVTLPNTGDPHSAPYDDNLLDGVLGVQTTPVPHPPKQMAAFELRRQWNSNVSETTVGVPAKVGTTSATVRSGYKNRDGTYTFGEFPTVVVTCSASPNCTASFPQPLGPVYYWIEYNTGATFRTAESPAKAVAN
jgi:hypothetical protein